MKFDEATRRYYHHLERFRALREIRGDGQQTKEEAAEYAEVRDALRVMYRTIGDDDA